MSQKGRANTSAVLNAIAAFGTGYLNAKTKEMEQERDVELISELDNPDLSPTQRAQIITRMSKGGQNALTSFLTQQTRAQKAQREEEELSQRQQREGRLKGQNEKKNIQDMYQARLKVIKDALNETWDPKDKKALKDERDALHKELSKNLVRMRNGQSPRFEVLDVEDQSLASQRLPIETQNQFEGFQAQSQPQQMNMPTSTQPQKMRWDPSNPQHQALAAQVFKDTGNDRARTNAILAEQFDR